MNNQVYWYTKKKIEYLPKLTGQCKTDVIVVGGGIAGLSAAENLLKSGLSVVLIEKDFCGSGASGKSSGFITPDSEIELSALISNYGKNKAKIIWEFVLSGVNQIKDNIISHKIDCDFQIQNSLFIANNKKGFKHTKDENEGRNLLGYESKLHNNKTILEVIGSKDYVGGVEYPETYGINAFLYCQAFRDILVGKGVKVYENTKAIEISEGVVKTEDGVLNAEYIVVATDRFIPELGNMEKEIYHAQTFLGISKPLTNEEVKTIFPKEKKMVWDTDLVYNYYRITGDNRLLIGGGDLFYTYARKESGNTARFKRRLTRYMKKKFPTLNLELEYIWPGLIGISKDLMPVIGHDPDSKKIWYVGAATGLPWASALGNYIAEKIVSGRDDFDEIFSYDRKYVIGRKLQAILTTPPTYAISNGITKYF